MVVPVAEVEALGIALYSSGKWPACLQPMDPTAGSDAGYGAIL